MIRVMIIDDEAHVRRLYTDILTREGFEVIALASPGKVLDIIEKNRPDIIILDIELDSDNGLEFIEKFKAECPDLPIILNSAYSIYMSDFKTWMAEAYIVKSSDLQPLIDKIRELTGAKKDYEQIRK